MKRIYLEILHQTLIVILPERLRAQIVNRKLDYANELMTVLGSHLSEVHGLRLEWGIIALITIEVLFEVIHLLRL